MGKVKLQECGATTCGGMIVLTVFIEEAGRKRRCASNIQIVLLHYEVNKTERCFICDEGCFFY